MFICTKFFQDIIEFNEIIQCIFCNGSQNGVLRMNFSRIVNILLGNINYSNIIIESLSFNVIDKP